MRIGQGQIESMDSEQVRKVRRDAKLRLESVDMAVNPTGISEDDKGRVVVLTFNRPLTQLEFLGVGSAVERIMQP